MNLSNAEIGQLLADAAAGRKTFTLQEQKSLAAHYFSTGSTYDFARDVLGLAPRIDPDTGETHGIVPEQRKICDFLDYPWPKKLLLCSRGGLKTTCANAYKLRRWAKNPNLCIAQGGSDVEVGGNALKSVEFCANHLDGTDQMSKFVDYYGNYKGSTWRGKILRIGCRTYTRAEPSFDVFSPKHPLTGGHFDVVILDDLHDEKNTESDESIDFVVRKWEGMQPLFTRKMEVVVIGTLYHEADLYSRILDGEYGTVSYDGPPTDPNGWMVLLIPAATKVGESWDKETLNFPFNLPNDLLLARQTNIKDPNLFWRQYFLERRTEGTAIFTKLHYHVHNGAPDGTYNVLSADPAFEKGSDTDYSAYTIWGQSELNIAYQLQPSYCKRVSPTEFAKDLVADAYRLNVKKIGVEKNALGAWVMDQVKDVMNRSGRHITLVPLKSGGIPKIQRAKGIQARFQAGGLLFHSEDKAMERELLSFPGKHDDRVDTVSYLPQLLDWQAPVRSLSREMQELLDERGVQVDPKILKQLDKNRRAARIGHRVYTVQDQYGSGD